MADLVFNPPKQWKRCARCEEEFTNLTPAGFCLECAAAVRKQKKRQEEFLFPPVDQQSRAAGDDTQSGPSGPDQEVDHAGKT